MGLIGGHKSNLPKSDKSWWERQKEQVKERAYTASIVWPEMALYAWLTLVVLDLGLVTLGIVWGAGMLYPFLSLKVWSEEDTTLPRWVSSILRRVGIEERFGIELQMLISRLSLSVFLIACIAALVTAGVREVVAAIASLSIVALSIPISVIHAEISRRKGEGG